MGASKSQEYGLDSHWMHELINVYLECTQIQFG